MLGKWALVDMLMCVRDIMGKQTLVYNRKKIYEGD